MSSRRSFIAGAIASAACGRAFAGTDELYLPPPGVSARNDLYLPGSAAPGIAVSPTFMEEIDRMFFVEEGETGPKIRILFEFHCPRSPELYARIRPMLGKARFDWIPIPSPKTDDAAPAAALFARGATARTLRDVFAGKTAPSSDAEAARRQGRLFAERVSPVLFVETNRPFATPTLAYAGRDAETRIIRGAPDIGTLRTIVASAR